MRSEGKRHPVFASKAYPNPWLNEKGPSTDQLNGRLRSSNVGSESISDQLSRFSGSMTPASVSAVIVEAENGRPRRYVDLVFGVRRRDGHIHDCIQTRELGVQSLAVHVVPRPSLRRKREPGARSKFRKSEEIAKELENALNASKNFSALRAGMQGDGLLFGRSYHEIIWRATERGRLWPHRFKHVHPRRFVFRQSDSKLLFDPVGYGNEQDGVDFDEWPTGKLISYFPRVNGDSLLKEGVGQLAVWLGMFRNWGVRDYLQTAESSWKPRRKGVYQKEATKRDKEGLVRAMKMMSQTGACVIPSTTDIQELWIQSQTKGEHQMLLTWLGREFTKATLGSPDAIEPSDTGSSKVDADIRALLREELRESDAVTQSVDLTDSISIPFTKFNYGSEDVAPLILLLTENVKDLAKYAETIETLQRTGLEIGEDHVRDKTGIPRPEPGEKILVSPMFSSDDESEGGRNQEGDQNKPTSPGNDGDGNE